MKYIIHTCHIVNIRVWNYAFTHVVIKIKIFHSCCSRVVHVAHVSHLCCTRVARVLLVLCWCCCLSTRVALVLHLCCSCLTRVTLVLLVLHLCCIRVALVLHSCRSCLALLLKISLINWWILIDGLLAGYSLFSYHVFTFIPNRIHSFLLSISWKVWTCLNFSINWNQFLICWKYQIFYYITQLVDFKKSNSIKWIV